MAIYQVNNDEIIPIESTTFAERGLKERSDLQRLLKRQIEIISPDTLVIAEEFGEWEESRRRIDLLGIDKEANIVVLELKRTEDGGHMELQAVRYAAMVSTLTFDRVIDIYDNYLKTNGLDAKPREKLLDFLEWEEADEDQFAQDVRIVLASAEFSKELTTSVIWLNERDLDIRCVRLKPYKDGERTLLDVQTVIPLPEAESYQVKLKKKQQKERQSRKTNRDLTRYDITLDGETFENLPKRWLIFHIVKHVIDSGVTPEEIKKVITWKKNTLFQEFDGTLNEEQILSLLTKDQSRRYFRSEDQIFHIEGKSYIFTKMWGQATLKAVGLLIEAYSNLDIEFNVSSDLPEESI